MVDNYVLKEVCVGRSKSKRKAQSKCEKCFIEWQQCFIKLQSLLKYSYAWIAHTFVNNRDHLECVNIPPETIKNSMSLLFHFILKCLAQINCVLILLIQRKYQNERQHNLVASKSCFKKASMCKLVCNYNSCVSIKLPSFDLQGTSEYVNVYIKAFPWKSLAWAICKIKHSAVHLMLYFA